MTRSIKKLREICQVSKAEDTAYGYYSVERWLERNLFRKISIYITWLFLVIGISANQTTLISFLAALTGGVFLTFADPRAWIIGFSFFFLRELLDNVDGEIARYNKSASIIGSFWDGLVGSFARRYQFVCMSFGLYNIFHDNLVFILGLVILFFFHTYTWAGLEPYRILHEKGILSETHETTSSPEQAVRGSVIVRYGRMLFLFGVDLFQWAILVVAIIDCFISPFNINHIPLLGSITLNARYTYFIILAAVSVVAAIMRVYYTAQGGLKLQRF